MREIADRLWIGNAMEARDVSSVLDAEIEAIVDLAIEEPSIKLTRELIYCRVPISDGSGNDIGRLQLAIEMVCRLVRSETPTLVACSAGMSRSPAIAAAALVRCHNITMNDALAQVAKVGPCDVSPGLLGDVVKAM